MTVKTIVKHKIASWVVTEAVEEIGKASFIIILLNALNHFKTKLPCMPKCKHRVHFYFKNLPKTQSVYKLK